MISFLPDLNVWLALSVLRHPHNAEAWNWLRMLQPGRTKLIFSRYTQIGLLRLLTNTVIMGEETLTLGNAWEVYEGWLEDSRIEFQQEPRGIDSAFRDATMFFVSKQATKLIGDCYLLAFAQLSHATLVTFDRSLQDLARKQDLPVIVPS
jgi:toxin-antitoxin system PIN domain toxin